MSMTATPPGTRAATTLRWCLLGALAEAAIFLYCYLTQTELGEVFRHAARYSGRLSLLMYLWAFGTYAMAVWRGTSLAPVKRLVTVFCVMHFIHFGFLATNVLMNDIELVPFKLAGGFLGYLMILLYPFFIDRIRNRKLHFVYFLYLGVVMIATYMARIKGDFDGVTPGPIHYFGVAATVLALVVFGVMVFRAKPATKQEGGGAQVQGKEGKAG